MKKLASNCKTAIRHGCFEPLADKYRPMINDLPLDMGIIDLADILSWGVYTSKNDSTTAMELLTSLANRYNSEKSSTMIDETDNFNLLMFIATDRPVEYLEQLDRAHRLGLARAICWNLETEDYTGTENEIDDYDRFVDCMCNRFIEGKDTQTILNETKEDVGYHHRDLESLIQMISNLIQGNDKINLIKQIGHMRMSLDDAEDHDQLLEIMVSRYGNTMTRTELRWLITSIDTNFKAYIESTRGWNELKLPSYEMGSLIWNLDSDFTNLNMAMGNDGRLTQEIIQTALREVYDRFHEYWFAKSEFEHAIIDLIGAYRESGGDSAWFSGYYLKSVKLYLLQDASFKMFCEDLGDEGITRLKLEADEELFRNLIYRFNGLEMTTASESISSEKRVIRRERELDARERELEERERQLESRSRLMKDRNQETDEDKDMDQEEEDERSNNRDYDIDASQSTKGYRKSSKTVSDTSRNIYNAYHKFKRSESAVTSQLDKMLSDAKTAFSGGDKTEAILSGKRWTPTLILKQALRTAAIFAFSKIGGIVYLVTTVALDKKRTDKQRRAILGELDTEIRLLDEKIEDARGDGNRQAKYALIRTRGELQRARDKIQYNLSASREDLETAKSIIRGKRYSGDRR